MSRCATPRCRNLRKPDRRICCRCHMRRWRESHPLTAAFATLRDHARARQITFTIDLQTFRRFAERSRYLTMRGLGGEALTVDRKDNLRGYEPGNIQPLTRSANSTKRARQDAHRMRAVFAWQHN